MSFSELIKLLREFREEMKNVKEEYFRDLKPMIRELIEELKRLNENLERCAKCRKMSSSD